MIIEKKLFIHIGLHKTATSYLQFEFFPRLKDVEIMNHPRFYQDFTSHIKKNQSYLISSEGISGVAWNLNWLKGNYNDYHWINAFEFGIQKLKTIYPHAVVFCFFRPHGDLLVSMYKQYIHEGGILNLSEFYGENGVIRPKDLCFEKRINTLRSTLDDVFFLSYEEFKKFGDDYLIKFFRSFGVEVNSGNGVIKKSNVSVSGYKLEMLRQVNKLYINLPIKVRKGFYRLGISPRQIFQKRLSFWKSKDTIEIIRLKKELNEQFKNDWLFFEKFKTNVG